MNQTRARAVVVLMDFHGVRNDMGELGVKPDAAPDDLTGERKDERSWVTLRKRCHPIGENDT
jgi:hypothetical protein